MRAPPGTITLRPLSAQESAMIIAGTGRGLGPTWAEDYPTADTMIALRLLFQTYEALGRVITATPAWWLCQIVADETVVGDIGFHGPPDAEGAVEIGYGVVPSRRDRGVATAACRLIVDRARAHGARRLIADASADNPASRAVLRSAGFTDGDSDRFVLGLG